MSSPTLWGPNNTSKNLQNAIELGNLKQLRDTGTINYIANYNAESGLSTGWATYADAAQTTPVDGTGGSPSSTFVASADTSLRGSYNFLWTHSAANRQGEGFSYDFTIDPSDATKVLQCSFEYKIASGTYADNDMSVWLYDVTNSTLIQPTPYLIKNSNIIEKFAFEFQATTSTSYRLIFHVDTSTATAYTIRFDSFFCGPAAKLYGSPVTDWVSYTPTVSGFGTSPTVVGKWRRVGDTFQGIVSVTVTNTTGAGAFAIGTFLPSGLSVDTSKMQSGNSNQGITGSAYYNNTANGAIYSGGIVYNTSSGLLFYGDSGALQWSSTVPVAISTNTLVNFNFSVPITGWSSSVVMSSDANTNVVAQQAIAGAQTPTGTPSTGSGGVCKFNSITKDTNGSYSSSTGQYTVSTPGYYFVSANVEMTHSSVSVNSTIVGANILVNSTVNHSNWVRASSTSVLNYIVPVSGIVYANAGDTIQINGYSNGTGPSFVAFGSSALYGSSLSINKISGPAQISSGAIVATRAYKAANQTISTNGSAQKILFDTTSFDITGSWASNKFTAPTAGIYDVSAYVEIAAANVISNDYILFIYKNGASYSYQYGARPGTGVNFGLSAKDTISLLAGDYIEIYFYGAGNNSVSTITMTSGSDKSSVAIKKIGGVY